VGAYDKKKVPPEPVPPTQRPRGLVIFVKLVDKGEDEKLVLPHNDGQSKTQYAVSSIIVEELSIGRGPVGSPISALYDTLSLGTSNQLPDSISFEAARLSSIGILTLPQPSILEAFTSLDPANDAAVRLFMIPTT